MSSTNEQFYRLPRFLYTEAYAELSNDAKLLYMFMVAEYDSSDLEDDVSTYIHFRQQDIMDKVKVSKQKACNLKAELIKFNLIEDKKQGLGKPNKIYVMAPVNNN